MRSSFGQFSNVSVYWCDFVVFGDWAGQLASISDRETIDIWKELPTSDFMHQLVNGLSIQINKYRRGKDYDRFKFV